MLFGYIRYPHDGFGSTELVPIITDMLQREPRLAVVGCAQRAAPSGQLQRACLCCAERTRQMSPRRGSLKSWQLRDGYHQCCAMPFCAVLCRTAPHTTVSSPALPCLLPASTARKHCVLQLLKHKNPAALDEIGLHAMRQLAASGGSKESGRRLMRQGWSGGHAWWPPPASFRARVGTALCCALLHCTVAASTQII